MAGLGSHFKVNIEDCMAKKQAVFQGQFYRITILSELLVRLEFSDEGYFENRLTELVKFRNFPVPQMKIDENDNFLDITTKYFNLKYVKERPFTGKLADSNLKIVLLDGNNKEWYYNHPEVRNYGGVIADLDKTVDNGNIDNLNNVKTVKKKIKDLLYKEKGLYSPDGFSSIDDSKSNFIDENGMVPNLLVPELVLSSENSVSLLRW